MTPSPRITQKDVAREAGVSHVTVSLALRERREIPAVTRLRIQKIARRLGYSPDPMLKALSAYRTSQRPAAFHSTLGWVDNWPLSGAFHDCEDFRLYYAGAVERARELGYSLDRIRLLDFAPKRHPVQRVLAARGIKGLLVAPVYGTNDHLDLDWSRYSAVRLGYSMQDTVLHTVTNSQYRSSFLAVEKLFELGYRRIGFLYDISFNVRTGGHFLGGYLSACAHLGIEPNPTAKEYSSDEEHSWMKIFEWIKETQPDVILANSGYILPRLTQRGIRVPEDVSVACLSLPEKGDQMSGIHQNGRNIGRAAINLLVSILERQETGIPDTPMHVLIEGSWRNGKTTRRKQRRLKTRNTRAALIS